jgi:hypothetical protein
MYPCLHLWKPFQAKVFRNRYDFGSHSLLNKYDMFTPCPQALHSTFPLFITALKTFSVHKGMYINKLAYSVPQFISK